MLTHLFAPIHVSPLRNQRADVRKIVLCGYARLWDSLVHFVATNSMSPTLSVILICFWISSSDCRFERSLEGATHTRWLGQYVLLTQAASFKRKRSAWIKQNCVSAGENSGCVHVLRTFVATPFWKKMDEIEGLLVYALVSQVQVWVTLRVSYLISATQDVLSTASYDLAHYAQVHGIYSHAQTPVMDGTFKSVVQRTCTLEIWSQHAIFSYLKNWTFPRLLTVLELKRALNFMVQTDNTW